MRISSIQLNRQGINGMLDLARRGEWGLYVDRYYGERHKFRPGDEKVI